jgi:Skp family chaperone for outer membrane proteins
VKKAFLAVAAALIFQTLSTSFVLAQTQPADAGFVALLDVVRVFNENADHASRMERIRQQAESVKAHVEAELEKIRIDAQPLQTMPQGTPERNALEGQLEQRQTGLKTQARQQEMDLLKEEATVYFQTWNRMQEVLTQVATQNKISLVLRFDSADIDAENRADVIKGVNRSVIYHDTSFDITGMVIELMGPTVASQKTGASGTTNR